MISEKGRNLCFVLGLPRSGTTLLCAMLAAHEKVLCPPEPWVMLAVESMGRTSPSHPADPRVIGRAFREFTHADEDPSVPRQVARALYNRRLKEAGKAVLVDKTPRYYHILDYLERVFPQATYVWIKRDPLDVAASYVRTWGVDLPVLLHEEPGAPEAMDFLVGLPRLQQFAADHADRVLTIAYEDLTREPEAVMARVFERLGLEACALPERLGDTLVEHKLSSVGDRKILETAGVHARSVGVGVDAFSDTQLSSLYGGIGSRTLRDLGYAETADAIAQRGIPDADEAEIGALRAQSEAELAKKWESVTSWSDLRGRDGPETVYDDLDDARRRLHESREKNAEIRAQASELRTQRDEWEGIAGERLEAIIEEQRKVSDLEKEVRRTTAEILRLNNRPFRQQIRDACKVGLTRGIEKIANPKIDRPVAHITLVTPCYNAEATIRETIESVLAQDYKRLQYIIVDGGSTDGTMDIVREYEEHIDEIISEPDNGMYDAIGKGFDLAKGEVYGYLNADDVLEPGGLQRVGEFFRDNKRVNVAYREDTIMVGGWRFPNAAQPHVDMWSLLRGHILFQDGVYFRRKAYRDIHGVDRTMRLAGDYDLWLRLSRHFKLVRVPGHVSCFRIRPGQLSTDMDAYHAEQAEAKKRFRQRMRLVGWARRTPRRVSTLTKNALERVFRPRKWHYPVAFAGPPAPGEAPPTVAAAPECPLTGRPMDRLLFSTRDTRFRCPQISYAYANDASGVVVTYPPLDRGQLNELYEKWYSSDVDQPVPPPAGTTSPYRGYYDKRWLFGRVVRKLEMPWHAQKVLNHRSERGTWGDITYRDLRKALGRKVRANDSSVRFLDAGCFEGELLDTIARETQWQGFGLEANRKAVEAAREKGHTVYEAFCEGAVLAIPEDKQFDVIFLGQVIEHLNEPAKAVRELVQLLAPGGVLVLSTPNLDSAQIRMFGPTWSHWHMPYHRVLFTRRAMRELGRVSGLSRPRITTYSNSFWSAYSVKVNQLGVAGSAPHTWHPDPKTLKTGRSIAAWSRLVWNWRGMGDYLFAVYRKL